MIKYACSLALHFFSTGWSAPWVSHPRKTGRVSDGLICSDKNATQPKNCLGQITIKRKGLARNMNFDDTARFFGPSNKLWPELFRPPVRQGTKLCLDCRKREVKQRQRYCRVCARNRKRESDRRHARAKRRLDVGKVEIRPLGLKDLGKQKSKSAILTLKLQFWSLVFRYDKRLQRALHHEWSPFW
jgi:hypothetical protein